MLVGAQFALLGALLLLRRRRSDWPTPLAVRVVGDVAMMTGVVVAAGGAAGLGVGLTVSPLPNANAQLRSGGMYRWVRHPIYSGLLLASAGWTVNSGDRRHILLWAGLVALLRYKAGYEENVLRATFTGYGQYSQITPRFVPSPSMLGRSISARCGSERDAGVVCN